MMKKLFFLTCATCCTFFSYAQLALNEIQPDGENLVEIINTGDTPVDASSYYLCSFPVYNQISTLTVVSGNLNIMPGELLVVSGHNMGLADDELGLYINNQYTNPASMVDYVEWGFHGHQRSTVAENAGIWVDMDFVDAPATGTSLAWDGGGDTSEHWESGATPSFGDPNGGGTSDCAGGMVMTTDGEVNVQLCTNDGSDDIISFETNSSSDALYIFILTDENDMIIGFPGTSNNFEIAPAGVCKVYGLSYTGNLLVDEGANLMMAVLSDDCYDLSDNYIEVNKHLISPEGSITTIDGLEHCVGDGQADEVTFINETETTGGNMEFIVTDEDGMVLMITAESTIDFDGFDGGVVSVYGVIYLGNLFLTVGDDINGGGIFEYCGELTQNAVDITLTHVDGGQVSANGSNEVSIVLSSGETTVDFTTTSTSTQNFAYILTDDAGSFPVLIDGTSEDFVDYDLGEYRVYGCSYSGELQMDFASTIDDVTSTGCFGLSENYAVVIVDNDFSIDDMSSENWSVYPNPTEGMVWINTAGQKLSQANVYSLSGEIVLNTNQNQIDLSTLKQGVYLIEIRVENTLRHERLIVK